MEIFPVLLPRLFSCRGFLVVVLRALPRLQLQCIECSIFCLSQCTAGLLNGNSGAVCVVSVGYRTSLIKTTRTKRMGRSTAVH